MLTMLRTLLVISISLIVISCASAPPEPHRYETWANQLSEMGSSYWSCTDFFTVEDVTFLLGAQPKHCKKIEKKKNTIGVIIKRDQEEPVITCVLPGSPAQKGGLRTGDHVLAVASDGTSTPAAALDALQKHMREGRSLIITTNRGPVSVIPQRALVQECYWEILEDGSTHSAEDSTQERPSGTTSDDFSTEPGYFRTVCTFLNGWLVDIVWNYRE